MELRRGINLRSCWAHAKPILCEPSSQQVGAEPAAGNQWADWRTTWQGHWHRSQPHTLSAAQPQDRATADGYLGQPAEVGDGSPRAVTDGWNVSLSSDRDDRSRSGLRDGHRVANPQTLTCRSTSATILWLTLLSPRSRSMNVIGTSITFRPILTAWSAMGRGRLPGARRGVLLSATACPRPAGTRTAAVRHRLRRTGHGPRGP